MTIIAVTGDAATTTAVALASVWPGADDVLLVEADPAGGDVAAWFDLTDEPSLSSLVTRTTAGLTADVDATTRVAANGLRVVPAPSRSGEATRAVAESSRWLAPLLARGRKPTAIVDCGAFDPSTAHPFRVHASAVVAVHRQSTQSPRAAAVRLQRFADGLAAAPGPLPVVACLVGAVPFGPGELAAALDGQGIELPVVALPVDDLAAAVIGGRTGVSSRRLARLPLMRAAGALAAVVGGQLRPSVEHGAVAR